MSKKIEILNEDYEVLKKNVLSGKIINRLDVNVSSLEIKDLNTLIIQKNEIPLSKEAVKGLSNCLGVTKKFVSTLDAAYEGKGRELLNIIVKALKGKKSQAITLVYNRTINEVTDIYPAGSKLISDSQYFEALESVIANTPGAYLRNITVKPNGNIAAIIANPKMEFDFGGFKDEVFKSGMTLDLTSNHMRTSFFTERLVCANGQTNTHKMMTKYVNVGEKVPGFLHAILNPDYHLSNIQEFRKRLNRCYHTTASLREVLDTDRKLRNVLGSSSDHLLKDMSVNHLKMEFGEDYLNNTDIHKFLNTDLTVWDLVNEITAVSSMIEQNGLKVEDRAIMSIQMAGGDRMFKQPDLAPNNIRQIFPNK